MLLVTDMGGYQKVYNKITLKLSANSRQALFEEMHLRELQNFRSKVLTDSLYQSDLPLK